MPQAIFRKAPDNPWTYVGAFERVPDLSDPGDYVVVDLDAATIEVLSVTATEAHQQTFRSQIQAIRDSLGLPPLDSQALKQLRALITSDPSPDKPAT